MRIEKCYFCSDDAYPGSIIHFVRNDCKIFKFCRSKCLRAFKNKRNPYKTKWTKAYRSKAGKDLIQHPTYDFQSRKNTPVKYKYELYTKALEAVKRATEIKHKRTDEYMIQRTIHEEKADIIQKDISIMQSPASSVEHKSNEATQKAAVIRDDYMDESEDHFVDTRVFEKQLTEELDNTDCEMLALKE